MLPHAVISDSAFSEYVFIRTVLSDMIPVNALQVSVSFQADAHGVLWSWGDPHSAGIH